MEFLLFLLFLLLFLLFLLPLLPLFLLVLSTYQRCSQTSILPDRVVSPPHVPPEARLLTGPIIPLVSSPVNPSLCKGTCSSRNPRPIDTFLSYHHLSSIHSAFVSALSSVYIPRTNAKALAHPSWYHAMDEDMSALIVNGTRDFVPLSPKKSLVGCHWVLLLKLVLMDLLID